MANDAPAAAPSRLAATETTQRLLGAALSAVDPRAAVERAIGVDGDSLSVAGHRLTFAPNSRVVVVGGGKAGAAMAAGVEAVLGDRVSGVVNVKDGHVAPTTRVAVREASHPVPDGRALAGVAEMARTLADLTPDDIVLALISGGGSALLAAPVDGVSLDDLQRVTALLLRAGATINELNTVRRHLSRLAGGQLARLAQPARLVTLVLSDVVGSPLDVIASGPTVPDPTTYADALAVLEARGLLLKAPAAVVRHLRRGAAGAVPETPKPGDPLFAGALTVVLGDVAIAAEAARAEASRLGFDARLLTTYLEGEAREVGRVCAALARELVCRRPAGAGPVCLLLGGETTVTVDADGVGGRCQELALAAALRLDGLTGVAVAAVGTDGTDGPTDAAGAVADGTTVRRARAMGLDAAAFLRRHDSYTFFDRLDDLVRTGPTNTNVNDLVFIIADDRDHAPPTRQALTPGA